MLECRKLLYSGVGGKIRLEGFKSELALKSGVLQSPLNLMGLLLKIDQK